MALIHDTKKINGSQRKKKKPNPDFAHRLLHRQANSELHNQSCRSVPRSSHGLSTSRFRRSLSLGTNFFSLSSEKCTVGFVYIYSLCVYACLCVCILSRPIRSPGTNRSQHLPNPDQADLSLFLSQTHRTRS